MKKILVTGGAGFIGSHTCLLLLEKGYDLVIIDSLVNSSDSAIKRIRNFIGENNNSFSSRLKFYKVDLRDYFSIEKVFKLEFKNNQIIDAVIHFAGLKAVGESTIEPLKYWDFNVLSTVNLLKVMTEFKCKTIIFSSSATIYESKENFLINEETSIKPINPYGSTKATIEQILNDLYNSEPNDWKIANLRYFNPIGAHPSGLLGEDPLGKPNNIFPIILKVASGELSKLRIFGNDWNTPDGTGMRDYIHVMDLAEGHIKAFEFLERNKSGIINLNLGTGLGTTVLELINTFQKVNKIKINYIFDQRRPGDKEYVVADNKKARNILEWENTRGLEEMCRDGWNWQLNKNL